MNIKLIKTGGLVGNKMSASTKWKHSADDFNELVDAVKKPATGVKSAAGKKPDAFHYSIQLNDDESSRVPINIQSIPEKFNGVFKELFDNMKAD